MIVRQRKFLNGEPAVAGRVIDCELREVIQWIWHFFEQNKGQSFNKKFASEVYFH